jgi:hypothetical protein
MSVISDATAAIATAVTDLNDAAARITAALAESQAPIDLSALTSAVRARPAPAVQAVAAVVPAPPAPVEPPPAAPVAVGVDGNGNPIDVNGNPVPPTA